MPEDDRSGTVQLKKALKDLGSKAVHTGWFDTDKYPPDTARGRKGGMPVAQVAFWLNGGFGATPARPFFTEAVTTNEGEIRELVRRLHKGVINGSMTADSALGVLGQYIEGKIIDNIKSQKYAGLSESYKTWKKRFHSDPQVLIDTSLMWQSCMSKVEDVE